MTTEISNTASLRVACCVASQAISEISRDLGIQDHPKITTLVQYLVSAADGEPQSIASIMPFTVPKEIPPSVEVLSVMEAGGKLCFRLGQHMDRKVTVAQIKEHVREQALSYGYDVDGQIELTGIDESNTTASSDGERFGRYLVMHNKLTTAVSDSEPAPETTDVAAE